jgi:hypothetical protein
MFIAFNAQYSLAPSGAKYSLIYISLLTELENHDTSVGYKHPAPSGADRSDLLTINSPNTKSEKQEEEGLNNCAFVLFSLPCEEEIAAKAFRRVQPSARARETRRGRQFR